MRSDIETIEAEIKKLQRRILKASERVRTAERAGNHETELLRSDELNDLYHKITDAHAIILQAEYVAFGY